MTEIEIKEAPQCGSTCSWVVDGVSLEAQEAARAGAERAGMSLGQWTQAAIFKAAEERCERRAPTIAEDHRPERRYF